MSARLGDVRGTATLTRFALRQDRVRLAVWAVALGVVPVVFVRSFEDVYPTAAAREAFVATSAGNAAFVALYGPLTGSSLGQLVAWRSSAMPLVTALVCGFLVVRHTRAEEEDGRRELVGSAPVGRVSGLAAAVVVALLLATVIGVLSALTLQAAGLPAGGSWRFGAQQAVAGAVFAGVAAVAAQVATTARAARGLLGGAIGLGFVLRMAGDVSDLGAGRFGWARWVAPFGWLQHADPFGADRWWPLALGAAVAACLVAAAALLVSRRDVGAGLRSPRPGPTRADPRFASPAALAWRLHRSALLAWVLSFAAFGAVLGAVSGGVDEVLADSPGFTEMLDRVASADAAVDAYLGVLLSSMALMAAGFSVQVVLRLRAEEASGRADVLLSTAVTRRRWVAGHLAVALLGPVAALGAGGLALGSVHGFGTGRPLEETGRVLVAALAGLPAVWVVGAVAMAVVGLVPRASGWAWVGLGWCVAILLVGVLVDLGPWLLDLSPFTHVPQVPGGHLALGSALVLVLVAAGVAATGVAGLERRDLSAG